jgi:ribose-phosphate pyrophosphokinase
MEYMARVAYDELSGIIKKRSVDFHVVKYHKFSRGEILPEIQQSVRLKRVFLFYDFNGDACHDMMVLMLTISALQDSGADSITLVLPFFPFQRQDRKDRSRVPISVKVVIEMMTDMFDKVDHVITLDMHSAQIEAAFKQAPDHLPGHVIFVPWILEHYGDRLNDLVIVGPDAGSEKRVDKIAELVGCKRAFLTKKRNGKDVAMHEIHGAKVKGKICIINDDIMDTCGTITKAAAALKSRGAAEIILTGTHPVFGGDAYKKLEASGLQVVTTDSIRTEPHDWLTVLPLARYMGHAILQNNIVDGSVSTIINDGLPKESKSKESK